MHRAMLQSVFKSIFWNRGSLLWWVSFPADMSATSVRGDSESCLRNPGILRSIPQRAKHMQTHQSELKLQLLQVGLTSLHREALHRQFATQATFNLAKREIISMTL